MMMVERKGQSQHERDFTRRDVIRQPVAKNCANREDFARCSSFGCGMLALSKAEGSSALRLLIVMYFAFESFSACSG